METICMKYQILFSEKNKKNITTLSTAEFAQRVVKVKVLRPVYFFFITTTFQREKKAID